MNEKILRKEKLLLHAIENKKATRESIAIRYKNLMKQSGAAKIDWKKIDGMILRRYKPSGLDYIKELAWRLAKEE